MNLRKQVSLIVVLAMLFSFAVPVNTAKGFSGSGQELMHSIVQELYARMAEELLSCIQDSNIDEIVAIIRHDMELFKMMKEKAEEFNEAGTISEKKDIILDILEDIKELYIADIADVNDYITYVSDFLEENDVDNAFDLIDLFIANDFQTVLDILKTYTFDISGYVFNDKNANATWDDGENGIKDQSVLVIPVDILPTLITELTPIISQLSNLDLNNLNLGSLLKQVNTLAQIVCNTDSSGKFTAPSKSMGFYIILRSPVALPFNNGSLDYEQLPDMSFDVEYEETGSVTNPYVTKLIAYLPELLNSLTSVLSGISETDIDFDSLLGVEGINTIFNLLFNSGSDGLDLTGILNGIGGSIPGIYFTVASPYGNLYTFNNGTFNFRPQLLFSIRKLNVVSGYVFEDTNENGEYYGGVFGSGIYSNGRNGVTVYLFKKTVDNQFTEISQKKTSAEGFLSILGIGSPGAYGFTLKYDKTYCLAIKKDDTGLPGGIIKTNKSNSPPEVLSDYYVISEFNTNSQEQTVYSNVNFWYRRLNVLEGSISSLAQKFKYTLTNKTQVNITCEYIINNGDVVQATVSKRGLISYGTLNKELPMIEGVNTFTWRSSAVNEDNEVVYSDWETLTETAYKITTVIVSDPNIQGEDKSDTASYLLSSSQNRTVTITPASGHEVKSATVNGNPVTVSGNKITISKPTENKSIIVYIGPKSYTVTKNVTGGTTDAGSTAVHDTDFTFTTAVSSGYNPSSVTVSYKVGSSSQKQIQPVGGVYKIPGNEITGNITITVTFALNSNQSAPTETLTGVVPTSYGLSDGKITGTTTAMEYRLSTNTDYTAVTGNEITGLLPGTYYVRYAAKTGFNVGTDKEIIVGQGPNVDQGIPIETLTGIAPTSSEEIDGIINGTTAAMEYRLVTNSVYVSAGDGKTIRLIPGSYYVRYAAKEGFNAGLEIIIIVPTYEATTKEDSKVIVIVNDKQESLGEETWSEEGDNRILTVDMDNDVLNQMIDENIRNDDNTVIININDRTSDIVNVNLTGDIVRRLEDNNFTVSVTRDNIQYNIPASELTINDVANKLGVDSSELQNIVVEVQIANVSEEVMDLYRKVVEENENELILPPVNFNITAKTTKADGTTEDVSISSFDNFVERVFEIPEGIDPAKVTTGIVFTQNADGTWSYTHAPTEVFQKDGKWYARISSLTNSTYSVIYNPVKVASVNGHWAIVAVNDMASRLVLTEYEKFLPDKAVTRAEMATYLIRAVGLYRNDILIDTKFTDVKRTDKNFIGVALAEKWGIITGYSDGSFKPDQKVTRQEAMIMLARAMDIVKYSENTTDRFKYYLDGKEVSSWALIYVKKVVNARIFNGREHALLAPNDYITHAEALTAIRNLLINAGLINK